MGFLTLDVNRYLRTSSIYDIHRMKKIVFRSEHRKRHFEMFTGMSRPHFAVTAPVTITGLQDLEGAGTFNTRVVYLIARAANEIPFFRQRIRDGQVIEHQQVHPSFTVPTEASEMFSFCTVRYHQEYAAFHAAAEARRKEMWKAPSLEDEPGRDDYLFLSAIPWLRFTSIQHAMHDDPADSVPRISWGKYYPSEGELLMPLSVQVHHALMDARHVALFFETFEDLVKQAPQIFAAPS